MLEWVDQHQEESDAADERWLVKSRARLKSVNVRYLLQQQTCCEESGKKHPQCVQLVVSELKVRLNPENVHIVDFVLTKNLDDSSRAQDDEYTDETETAHFVDDVDIRCFDMRDEVLLNVWVEVFCQPSALVAVIHVYNLRHKHSQSSKSDRDNLEVFLSDLIGSIELDDFLRFHHIPIRETSRVELDKLCLVLRELLAVVKLVLLFS